MEIGAVFMILAVIVLAGLFIGRPFLEVQPAYSSTAALAAREAEHERSSLLAEYERQLNGLKELEFDYTLGKIPEEIYPQQRLAMMQTAAEMLRRLDAFEEKVVSKGGPAPQPAQADQQPGISTAQAEERVEADIAARRVTPPPAASDDLEALIAARRRTRQEKASGFCPGCGKPIQKSDKFCPKCGTVL
jgi:hypothetical protein